MWEGVIVFIFTEVFRGIDNDLGFEDLVYIIERFSNGRVVL